MNVFTVSFFGHRIVEEPLEIEKRVEILILKLLHENTYVRFLVGRNGEFDQIVASVIHRYKRTIREDNCELVCVLPYVTAELSDNKEALCSYYDYIEICEASANTFFKKAYQVRNSNMVERSDLVVFCVQHESGGAWRTMKYAMEQKAKYINLRDMLEDI